MNLPNTRTADLIEQETSGELLIYDLRNHKAYHLNETLMNVFRASGERISFAQLKQRHGYTDDIIHLALQELGANKLLENYQPVHFAGMSRREVIKKVGLASMIALPLIVGLTAPLAAHAASGANVCAAVACNSINDCRASCSVCAGTGRCGISAQSCTNLGSACLNQGTCNNGVCSNGFAFCNTNRDCLLRLTCVGVGFGTCQA